MPGQYPPLAGSEVELGDATNQLIAIVLKGLQGPVVIEGKPFNNAMQAWEASVHRSQLAAILTYVRSDWGNNAPADHGRHGQTDPGRVQRPKRAVDLAGNSKDAAEESDAERTLRRRLSKNLGTPAPASQQPAPNGQTPAQPAAQSQPLGSTVRQSQPPAPSQMLLPKLLSKVP